MKILIILAHPNPASFNHAMANACREELLAQNHEVIFHDLYTEKFDPFLYHEEFPDNADLPPEIAKHCDELSQADGIIIVHPNWWGQPPAILKGWVDRIIRPGVAYRFLEGDSGEGVPEGLLKAQTAIVFNTSNTNETREMNIFGDPLERIWKDCIFQFCGIRKFYRKMFRIICVSNFEKRQKWLDEVREIVNNLF